MLWQKVMLGNPLDRWLAAAAAFIALLAVFIILKKTLCRRLSALAERTATTVDDFAVDLLKKTKLIFLTAVTLYIGTLFLKLPASTTKLIQKAVILALLLQAAFWGSSAITYWIKRYKKTKPEEDALSATTFAAVGFLFRIVLWSLILLIALDNLGIKITTLIAGLGIGGIAVALAVQNILGDLFASLSLVLDKPFVVGDFIVIDDFWGTVQHVGLKTTRLKSLSGEQLVFANSDLLKSRIRNFQRMEERRVAVSLNVVYQTPPQKLALVPEVIRETIEATDKARFDRAHLKACGDFALIFEAVYWVLDPDYNVFMDVQQAVNFGILKRFAEEGIEFAHPTQTVYMGRKSRPEDPDGKI